MGQLQSLADQLGWCITTKDYLNNLNMELKSVAQQYQRSIDNLREFGYIAEMMPHLENLCSEFQDTIDSVVDYIENEHIEYVHNRSGILQGLISETLG